MNLLSPITLVMLIVGFLGLVAILRPVEMFYWQTVVFAWFLGTLSDAGLAEEPLQELRQLYHNNQNQLLQEYHEEIQRTRISGIAFLIMSVLVLYMFS